LHSVGQNHFYVMMLIIHGCFIQSLHFSYELQENSVHNSKKLVQFPCIRPDNVVFRPDTHLSSIIRLEDEKFLSRPSICVQKLRTVLGCICPDVSATRPDAFQCSTSKTDFFPKHRYGKIAATIRTM
jgi:hypothetical protein